MAPDFRQLFTGISIHAPREGSDRLLLSLNLQIDEFLSTLPARGATNLMYFVTCLSFISIHAPREGSDTQEDVDALEDEGISIHAPREGSDLARGAGSRWRGRFLSTLPARGATTPGNRFEPHYVISIHAPREGSDPMLANLGEMAVKFLSTLPARGATSCTASAVCPRRISIHAPREGSDVAPDFREFVTCISIHAPREGSDNRRLRHYPEPQDFYPRSPRGERLAIVRP